MPEGPMQVAELCGRVADLNAKYGRRATSLTASVAPPSAAGIVAALEQFMECVRYLNTRRSEATLKLDSEATVQDAVYLLLRASVSDLTPESPTDRIASRYTIKDFRSLSARCIIEAKYVRDKDHGRSVSREMHDDIETYRHDSACDTIVFFVYDPNVHIPDRAALQRQVEVERTYGGRPLYCRLIVKP
jgi:hypothetical protein